MVTIVEVRSPHLYTKLAAGGMSIATGPFRETGIPEPRGLASSTASARPSEHGT